MLDSVTGYARITTFANAKVADDLHDALGRLEWQGMRRLVLAPLWLAQVHEQALMLK